MKKILTILKKIGAWIIGLFAIFFGIYILFDSVYILTKIFAGLLTITGLYIIPLIRRHVNITIKPLFISIFFLVVFLGIPISETSQKHDINNETEECYITANVLNVREGQGTNFKIICKLKKGDKINLISKEDNWAKISIDNEKVGYVSSKYISNKEPNKKDDKNWLIYIVIGIIVVIGMFSNGESSTMSEKETASESNFVCKYCGYEDNSLKYLTSYPCSKSPTGNHIPYEKGIQSIYNCKHCGYEDKSLKYLTSYPCSKSPTGNHIPYEKGIQPIYNCKYCGYTDKSLKYMTSYTCSNSPTGNHEPM